MTQETKTTSETYTEVKGLKAQASILWTAQRIAIEHGEFELSLQLLNLRNKLDEKYQELLREWA